MAKEDVRLLGSWASPFVMRPRIAFNIKSVTYEFLQETFGSKSHLLLQSNPIHKKIPVLIHNNKPIPESLIIVEYIDETWTSAPSILPSDPYERATARFWAAYVDDKWFVSLKGLLVAEEEGVKKALVEKVVEGMSQLEDAFLKLSKGKGFFGGDRIGLVDIALGSMLAWLRVMEKMAGLKLIDGEKTPGLAKWAERFAADGAVKDVMPDVDKLLEFAKVLQAAMRGQPSK